jgi:hypothetical protein
VSESLTSVNAIGFWGSFNATGYTLKIGRSRCRRLQSIFLFLVGGSGNFSFHLIFLFPRPNTIPLTVTRRYTHSTDETPLTSARADPYVCYVEARNVNFS